MELCITRFNNRTFYENYMYNMKIPISEDLQKHKKIFDKWTKFDIPSVKKRIKDAQIRMKTTDVVDEKKYYRKSIAQMRKDIVLLETMQRENIFATNLKN